MCSVPFPSQDSGAPGLSYRGVHHDQSQGKGSQCSEPGEVLVPQDLVVLAGDDADLVNNQLLWREEKARR